MADPRDLLREALHEYQSGDGATRLGSYQDVVADLLHMAHDDETLRAEQGNPENSYWASTLISLVTDPGYRTFLEERINKEIEFINNLSAKDLPLYIEHDWEFPDNSSKYLEERLREGKKI